MSSVRFTFKNNHKKCTSGKRTGVVTVLLHVMGDDRRQLLTLVGVHAPLQLDQIVPGQQHVVVRQLAPGEFVDSNFFIR